jgi:cytochrome c-type biogenesis protein CcmH
LTNFILACVGLVLLSSVFFLFPRARSGAAEEDLDRANLEWFRRRRAELAEEGDDALQEDARLRLLEDQRQNSTQSAVTPQTFPVWILLPLVALAAGSLYYKLGAAPDVVITHELQNMQNDMTPQKMRKLIGDVEARSAERPDNLHYLALLGRYYMEQEDYKGAAQTYDALAAAVPGDAQTLAYAAQAEYLSAGRTLSERARQRAEQALVADPQQRTALGLLGMASFEQQQYRAAIEYWQRLQALEPPDTENGQMIAQVIAMAHERSGEPAAATATTSTPAATATATPISQGTTGPASTAASGAGITVRVSAPVDASIAPTDTVFILARNPDSGSRMPIAVQRLTAAQLPITLRLDDSNSMAGQKLSQTPKVLVAVQVSPDGRPGEAGASWLGEAGPVTPSADTAPLDVVLHAKAR